MNAVWKQSVITLFWILSTRADTDLIDWGTECSYTAEPRTAAVDLYLDEEEYLSTIPAGKDKVFIDLSADADLDTKIVAADGTVLIEYKRGFGWTGGCVQCPESHKFTYNGMNIETCVDKCRADKTFTYRDGTVFNLHGSADYAEEWIYIDSTSEDLTLSVIGYEPGSGTLEWLWDCPMTCNVCVDVNASPSPGDEGSCFHGDGIVLLESGESKPFKELSVGDRIKTSDGQGQFSFSPVVKLPHKRNTEPAAFLVLSTESGKVVEMTSDHFIPKCGHNNTVMASELIVGDCLLTVDGKETLVNIALTQKSGVYTAVTNDKFIVVNGIVASPFSKNSDPENPAADYEKYRIELELMRARGLSSQAPKTSPDMTNLAKKVAVVHENLRPSPRVQVHKP